MLESNRKLRTLLLVKYSRISISHIDQVAKSTKNVENEIIAKAESLYGDLQFNILPTDNDVVVIFYITGYCCKFLVSRNKCAECKDATIAGISEARDDIPDSANQYIKDIDCGGLWKPKSEVFDFGCLCWKIFAELSEGGLRHNFLSCQENQLTIFKELVTFAFYKVAVISPWSLTLICAKEHKILEGIAHGFFNCMCKNVIREISGTEANKVYAKIYKVVGKTKFN